MSNPNREKLLDFLFDVSKLGGRLGDDADFFAAQIRRRSIIIGSPTGYGSTLATRLVDLENLFLERGLDMSAITTLCDAVLADPKASRYHKLAEEAKADARPTMRNVYMVTEGSKKPYETKDVDAVAVLLGLSTNSFRVYLSTNGGTLSRNGVKVERKKA